MNGQPGGSVRNPFWRALEAGLAKIMTWGVYYDDLENDKFNLQRLLTGKL
jgi:hypothetical protein